MEKIIAMLKSDDVEMAQLGAILLLKENVKMGEVELVMSQHLNPDFMHFWEDNSIVIRQLRLRSLKIQTGVGGMKLLEEAFKKYGQS